MTIRKQHTVPLLALFVGSGFAALVYEIVWFHLLRFTIGSAAISLAILLVSFMGGMSLGAGLFHRLISIRHHPIRVYALIELAIGACGILVPAVLPLVTRVYLSLAPHGILGIFLRALICLFVLLPPTILMGATLPAIARWMETSSKGVARLGLFYGGNIIGAVLGTVAAGFFLLREFDVFVASGVAVSINLAVALIALRLAQCSEYRVSDSPPESAHARGKPRILFAVMALSGFTALGAQVIWTRLLSLVLGTTVYTFSVILAVFLGGLGIGSVAGALISRRCQRPAIALAVGQALLMPAIAFASFAIAQERPFIDIVSSESSWAAHRINDVLRCAIAILPATFLWGASFPLAIATLGIGKHDPAKSVGGLYALNTIGAITAVILISAVLIPTVGTQISQQILIAAAGLSSALLLIYANTKTSHDAGMTAVSYKQLRARTAIAGTLGLAVLAFSVAQFVPALNAGLISYGRETNRWHEAHEYLYTKEGMTASIAVTRRTDNGYRSFHIGGKVVASTFPEDMRLQRLLGHMPAMIHGNPKTVLIIGFGAGVTAGSFVLHDNIERIVIVEIEPNVVSTAGEFFREENYDVLNDPRTEVIYDDGRHFLSTTTDTFDIITADPVNPWVKGAAALYTREFFELCKTRLNPGGLITQWVPLYETNEAAVKSEVGTFLEVFPQGSIWNSQSDAKGYDVFTMAAMGPMSVSAQDLREKLTDNQRLRESLAAVNVLSEQDLFKSFAGQQKHVADWLRGYESNRDRNLRLEYLAGLSLDVRTEQDIYARMTAAVTYPVDLFILSGLEEVALRDWFNDAYGKD